MNQPTPTSSRSSSTLRRWTAALAAGVALLGAGSAGAALIEASAAAHNTPVGNSTFNDLFFQDPGVNWYAYHYPTSGQVFVLGNGTQQQTQSGAYQFIRSTEAFQLTSIKVAWVGGNDTVDGWFEFYDGSKLVATGDKKKDEVAGYSTSLAFHVGGPKAPNEVDVTPTFGSTTPYYNRVVFVFSKPGDQPNYAGVKSFNIQAKDSANTTLGAQVTPVPEPHTYAMMLAGLGVVGVLSRRRRRDA